jgi:hypothetical protein
MVIIIFSDRPAWNRIHFRHLVVSQSLKKFPSNYAIRCMLYPIFPEHSPEPDNSISGDPIIVLKSIVILGY